MQTSDKNKKLNVLFIGDPNLGQQGANILKKFFYDATCIIWDIEQQDKQNYVKIRDILHCQMWDICFSFYNDFIFNETDLAHMNVALNFHPSLPVLRGVGYDTLPLIEKHQYFGVTLHNITKRIDSGKIISIYKKELPQYMTYSQLRKESQNLCLTMLEMTAKDIYEANDLSHTKNLLLRKSNDLNANWGPGYTSRKDLKKLLNRLRVEEPEHCVFK